MVSAWRSPRTTGGNRDDSTTDPATSEIRRDADPRRDEAPEHPDRRVPAGHKVVRTAGPFTVESLSPHRTIGVDENDELMDRAAETKGHYGREPEFVPMILENLRTTGVQQTHKEDKLAFTSVIPWPGRFVCAEGRYVEGAGKDDDENTGPEKRAAIFVGPEFGTVTRPDLAAATREAAEARFDVLVACAFSYDAHSSEFDGLGRVPVLKARMNADLHMADDLKNHRKGQPLRHLRRARHRDSRSGRKQHSGQDQRRGCLPSEHRGGSLRRP